ncbi:MAG: LPS export ABC transporter periplasmic protein LptC [Thermodesulfobacteriota bacterium]
MTSKQALCANLINIKQAKSILVIGILAVVAFWLGLYAFRTQKPPAPSPQPTTTGSTPGNVGLQEINFVQSRDGAKLWELKAEAVEYQEPSHTVSFKKVTLVYFPKGEQPIKLVGNLGNMDTQSKNILIEGEVVVSNPEGYEVKVPSLYYRDDLREISTEGVFNFRSPIMELDGLGMSMNLDSQKVWVKKKVRMTLYRSFLNS